ncbi:MAG: hypothetical protein EOP05_01155 [Proteobacteria bacterium]|nr:MAG: hypothetical protein EOP05_01155 [Pseudomonadota bacterium]
MELTIHGAIKSLYLVDARQNKENSTEQKAATTEQSAPSVGSPKDSQNRLYVQTEKLWSPFEQADMQEFEIPKSFAK